jgi:hypothetical protein
MKSAASALRHKISTDTVRLPAPACMFSKGLPLPFAGDSVSSAPDANVEEALCVGAGPEAWAEELDDAAVDDAIFVELILPTTVDASLSVVVLV